MKDIFLIIITTVERTEFYFKPDSHFPLWITFETTSHKNSNQTLCDESTDDLPDESLSCSFLSAATRYETVYMQVTKQNSISRSSLCEGALFFPWVLQELWAQPQESRPGISPQEEEAAAHLHLHHPSPRWQEMSLLPADQIKWHGDYSLLHSGSRR